jgi:hypothetical protein
VIAEALEQAIDVIVEGTAPLRTKVVSRTIKNEDFV